MIDAAVNQVREDMNRLRGRLFQLVEAVGLPKEQADAFKRCIRTTTYDAQADLERVLRNGAN
jgi:hypothetical protein